MNRKYFTLLTIVLCFAIISCGKKENLKHQVINLAAGWAIHPADSTIQVGDIVSSVSQSTDGWYKATLPSTVMGVLTANGEYKDSFVGLNQKGIDKTRFDYAWWYRSEFELPDLENGHNIFLNFDGISYYANIWLNGKLVASRDSVFGTYRRYSFDVTPLIAKKNILAVEVFRALPGDPNVGFADWNPRPADENMGIFRGVTLIVTDKVRLNNPHVKTKVNTESLDEAWITIDTEVENLSNEPVVGELKGKIESKEFIFPVSLAANEKKKISLTSDQIAMLRVEKPRLWWCNNMGTPELYDLELSFKVNDIISYRDTITFGIRQIESYLTEEGYRAFKLNGEKVLLKSAGWTDDIYLRDTPASNELQVKYVKDMNMNMIRFENFWGNSDNIYSLCDKYGLLVLIGWSCQWEWEAYYGKPCSDVYGCIQSDKDVDLIAKSFADQVVWLRNHPSIMAWMPGSDMLQVPQLEEKYLEFLKVNDDRPYIGAAKKRDSPISGKTGTKMEGPYEYVGPNYWYVDTKFGGAFGFNTETGIGTQLPVLESIKRFIPEDKLWPVSNEEWNYHCTGSTTAMNSLSTMTEVINNKYGEATNLEDYLMKADLVNYDGTRAMFEAFRANIEHLTGIVQWMLNSAWPSLYWQMYDYYGIPTSAYYSVKNANKPIQLIYNYGKHSIYAVNELKLDVEGYKAVVQVYGVDSKLREKDELTINLKKGTSVEILKLDALQENLLVSLELFDKEGKLIADNFYAVSSTPDEYLWDKTTWVHTPVKSYSDLKDLSKLIPVELAVSADKKEEKENTVYTIKVNNPSAAVAFFNNLKMKDNEGNMVIPSFWSDNYISLLPGQEKILKCTVNKKDIKNKKLKIEIKGWNSLKKEINL